jgi:MSHA biogenesis protein MshN
VPKPETVARLSSPVPVSAADPQPPGVPEPAVVEPDSDPVRQTVALVPETAATVGDAVQPSPVERHEKVESRLPAESTVVPPGDYLPLRNTRLPPSEKEKPQGVRHGTHSSVNVKTAKKSVPQPLVAVREAIADGELATAEYLLRQRLDAAPADREARELLIGLMLRGARYDDVGEQLDLGLSHYPGHIKFVLIKARLLAQAGEVDVAVRLLEDASASSDGKVERLQMLGALYQQQLNYQKALDSYQSLLELAPDAGPVWVGLAISLDALGDAGALDAYRRALRLGGLPAAAEQYSLRRTRQLESDGG